MTEYSMTNQEFICAAGSYFGLPGEQLMQGSKLETQEDGALEIVIRLALTPEDMIGIAKRMEAMREAQSEKISIEDLDQITERTTPVQFEELRNQYKAMSKGERSRYGSFARFAQGAPLREDANELLKNAGITLPPGSYHLARGEEVIAHRVSDTEGIGGRKVSHIDAPEEEDPPQMDAVWLSSGEATDAQKMHASDTDFPNSRYLVPWSMLTEEQRQKAKEAKP